MKNINEGVNELNDAVNNFDKKENEERNNKKWLILIQLYQALTKKGLY